MAPYYFCDQAGYSPWTVVLYALYAGFMVGIFQHYAEIKPRNNTIEELVYHTRELQATIDNLQARNMSDDREERLRTAEADLEMAQEENAMLREQLRIQNERFQESVDTLGPRIEHTKRLERSLQEAQAMLADTQAELLDLHSKLERSQQGVNNAYFACILYTLIIVVGFVYSQYRAPGNLSDRTEL